MGIKIGSSTALDTADIVKELSEQLNLSDPKLIILFASSSKDQSGLIHSAKQAFPGAEIIGCSTAGELVSGFMLKNATVAMALNEDVLEDFKVEILEGISQNPDVSQAIQSFESYFGTVVQEMDLDKYLGLVLIDGLSGAEEAIMDGLGNLSDILFIGGSAGDDLKFEKTFIYKGGKVYENAAVLLLMKLRRGYDVIKTQSFSATDKKLVVTKVSANNREVLEFNGEPAAVAYAEALGTTADQIGNYFMSNPVGVVVGEEDIYVRSPQQTKDQSITFYCSIPEGMNVSVLKSTDIIKDTRNALEEKIKAYGSLSGLINFNCILRTLEIEQEGLTEAYGQLFKDIPMIGFSTYGEAFIGHINQTATMILFK